MTWRLNLGVANGSGIVPLIFNGTQVGVGLTEMKAFPSVSVAATVAMALSIAF